MQTFHYPSTVMYSFQKQDLDCSLDNYSWWTYKFKLRRGYLSHKFSCQQKLQLYLINLTSPQNDVISGAQSAIQILNNNGYHSWENSFNFYKYEWSQWTKRASAWQESTGVQ